MGGKRDLNRRHQLLQEQLDTLEQGIDAVGRSTRTLVPAFSRLHNWLRAKSKLYYRWHLNPWATSVHFTTLTFVLFVAFAVVVGSATVRVQPAQAALDYCYLGGSVSPFPDGYECCDPHRSEVGDIPVDPAPSAGQTYPLTVTVGPSNLAITGLSLTGFQLVSGGVGSSQAVVRVNGPYGSISGASEAGRKLFFDPPPPCYGLVSWVGSVGYNLSAPSGGGPGNGGTGGTGSGPGTGGTGGTGGGQTAGQGGAGGSYSGSGILSNVGTGPGGSQSPSSSSAAGKISVRQAVNNLIQSVRTLGGVPGQTGETLSQFAQAVIEQPQTRQALAVNAAAATSTAFAAAVVIPTLAAQSIALVSQLPAQLPAAGVSLQLPSFIAALLPRRRRRATTLLVDENDKPLPGVVVRVVDPQFGRAVDTAITGKDGKFGFVIARPGVYQITVRHPQFAPYKSKLFSVENLANFDMPFAKITLTRQAQEGREGAVEAFAAVSKLTEWAGRLRPGFNLIGSTVAIYNAAASPSLQAYVIVLIFALLWYLELLMWHMPKPFGVVLDRVTRKPIGLALVRLLGVRSGATRLMKTAVTDVQGRFHFTTPAGVYRIEVARAGYEPLTSRPRQLKGKQIAINFEVLLDRMMHRSP